MPHTFFMLIVISEYLVRAVSLSFVYWRASKANETLLGVTQSRFHYIYLFIYMVRRTTFSARASIYVLVKHLHKSCYAA